jgi:hemolysin-activating ACP:hemolysin acyltransferase
VSGKTNGSGVGADDKVTSDDAEMLEKLAGIRTHVREGFGKIAMTMMALPRYRHQSIADLQHLVLDPLLRDRVAMAYPTESAESNADITALAIWASVSEEVDAKIREQIKSGVFPVRLKADDWNSGDINWLFDVVAPDQATTTRVLANFRQVVKEGDLRLHPLIARLVDGETLAKMTGQAAPEA